VQITAGPPVDLSAFAGKPLTAENLRAATDAIMADVTRLVAVQRGEDPPAVVYDPRANRADKAEPAVTAPDDAGTDSATPDGATRDSAGTDTAAADTAPKA
jgi:hypothetical protein